MSWLDKEAMGLGYAIFGLAIMLAWFWAYTKAADNGHKILATIIAIAPLVVFALSLAGVFR